MEVSSTIASWGNSFMIWAVIKSKTRSFVVFAFGNFHGYFREGEGADG
jgi:hypothetical protein